jgi:hypothetical protein
MTGAGCSGREVAFFDEAMRYSEQGQISGNTAAGRSTADNNDICFNHFINIPFLNLR